MKEHLIKRVAEIMKQIDDTTILTKIYIVAKRHLEILQGKEGVFDELN